MKGLKLALITLCVMAALLFSRGALAVPRVTIVVHKVNEPASEQFEMLLRSELLAMGFEVLTFPEAPAVIDPEALEKIAEQTQAVAAIIIEQPEGSISARLWVTERVTGKTLFRKVRPEKLSPEAPSIFALRSVELLRASLLELNEPHPTRGTVEAAPAVRALVAPARPPAAPPVVVVVAKPSWGAVAGAGVMAAPGGIPPAGALVVGMSWHPTGSWAAELRVLGPFSGHVNQGTFMASTEQEIGLLRFRQNLLSQERIVVPFLVAGVGVHRLAVQGNAVAPYHGQSNSAWTGLGLLGAGLRLRANRNVGIDLEVDGMMTAARQKVVFNAQPGASTGRPMVSGTLAVEVMW